MKDVLVSIIMPCYKAAGTLEKSVESIVAQTHINWELLLLEDGSPDESLEIARKCALADTRIRLIATSCNRGVVRMRNLGIRLAKGQWIAFCDADDWWIPQKLELQLSLAAGRQANLIYSAVYYVRDYGKMLFKEVQLIPDADYNTMLKTNAIPMSSAMYANKALGKHYFKEVSENLIHEDYAYWLQLYKKVTIRAAYVSAPTTFIRFQPHSRSSNIFRAARSQVIILRREGKLPYHRIASHMVFYAITAARKRFPWFGWKTG